MFRKFALLAFLKSLQARFLMALICIGIIPFALAGILLIQQERAALVMQASRELSGLAQGLSAELDNQLQGLLAEARVMAALPDIVGMSPKEQKPLLRLLHERYNKYGQLAVADVNGQLLVASTDMELINISRIPSFQAAAAGQQAWIVAPGLFNSQPLLHIHTPIREPDGQVVGVLGSPIPLPKLADTLRKLSVAGRQAFVLDASGAVLIHPDWVKTAQRQSYAAWIAPQLDATDVQTGSAAYELDDTAWLAGYATVPGYDWTIVVQRPQQEVMKPASITRGLAFSALCISIMLGLLGALAVAHSLTRPVRNLADAARALGEGNANAPLLHTRAGGSEVRALVQAFAAMRRAVIDREQSLRVEIEMREHAEAQIRKHQSAMAASIDGMALLHEDRLIYVNDALVKLYGYESAGDMLGKSWHTLYSQQEQRRLRQEAFPVLSSQGIWRGEAIGARRNGENFPHEISIALTDTGELVAVVHDLSQRKLSEEMLRQTQKLESLGLLAGGIAHDFNNLLAGMMGQISVAMHKLPPAEPARDHIAKALTSAERAADLTRQLLAYAGRGNLQQEVLDLNLLIKDNVHLVETALANCAKLVLQLMPLLPSIKADRGQMQQVIMNLLINAADAVQTTGGVITIGTALESVPDIPVRNHRSPQRVLEQPAPGEYVVLEIADTGCGMEPKTLERIFDPFFTTKTHGNGLGLSSTLGIIRRHRGHLQVESTAGRGSRFRIYIPASSELAPAASTKPHQVHKLGGIALVIDDEPTVRETAQLALELLEMRVLTAANGYQGLTQFEQHHTQISVVILDMKMPEMGGEETLRQLRGRDKAVPVILSSGYTESQIDSLLQQDANLHFLGKPYTIDQLAPLLESILTKHRAPRWMARDATAQEIQSIPAN
ncbi:MAG: cache domain-containing protein [Caldilineaceae bacterium]